LAWRARGDSRPYLGNENDRGGDLQYGRDREQRQGAIAGMTGSLQRLCDNPAKETEV
jgi:hypothetical protein